MHVTRENLTKIIDATSAFTAVGDEDSTGVDSATPMLMSGSHSRESSTENTTCKRYIPDRKKHASGLTFPEKLMKLMQFADSQGDDFCISWIPGGKSFVIDNSEEFTQKVLPKFFKATKFSSYTRKLYRWRFRKINQGIGLDDSIVFGNENFQRDNAELMKNMSSVTAANISKAEVKASVECIVSSGTKRPLEASTEDHYQRKCILLDRSIQQKDTSLININKSSVFALIAPNNSQSLISAIQTGIQLGVLSNILRNSSINNTFCGQNFAAPISNRFGYMTRRIDHYLSDPAFYPFKRAAPPTHIFNALHYG